MRLTTPNWKKVTAARMVTNSSKKPRLYKGTIQDRHESNTVNLKRPEFYAASEEIKKICKKGKYDQYSLAAI